MTTGTGEYWLGVDLGARVDRSAVVVVEAAVRQTCTHYGPPSGEATVYNRYGESKIVSTYARTVDSQDDVFRVAEIHRLDQGAPHSETLEVLLDIYARHNVRLCHFDDTGLGVGFHEYIRNAYRAGNLDLMPQGVTLTAKTKFEVMSALDRLVDEDRIGVDNISGADKLRQELTDFHYRYTAAGNVTTGARTESAHDDLVVATALAVYPTFYNRRPSPGGVHGYGSTRPCRVIKRTIHVPDEGEPTHA